MLQAIVSHEDFVAGQCDTSWLENNHASLLARSKRLSQRVTSSPHLFASNQIFSLPNHVEITKVLRNDFPTTFTADVAFTPQDAQSQVYTLDLEFTTASASASSTKHRHGSTKDPTHIIIPFPGKLVEVLVDVGDAVKAGDVVCVVKQMKMELEVRSPSSGTITWVTQAEDDNDVAEGMLAAILEADGKVEAKL
ncbi:hypothetical protein BDV97DRAFT_394654 [Delphinella strobiligena]|nr:hypothetical protein BDV97DRAFT_394654 [Delphinella strobiligena]